MNARLSSMLVAGAVILAGAPSGVLRAGTPAAESPAQTCTVQSAAIESVGNGSAVVRLAIPGYAQQPAVQVLSNPNRVVVDLPGVDRGATVTRKDLAAIHHPLIEKVRLAQFVQAPSPVTRLVLEVAPGTQVSVSRQSQGIQLALSAGQGQVVARFDASAAPMPVVAPVTETLVAQAEPAPAEASAATAAPAPAAGLDSLPATGTSFSLLPQMALGSTVTAQAPAAPAAPAPQASNAYTARTINEGQEHYTGSKISIDLTNTDLVVFLRYLAEVGKLNLVVDPDVQGTYTYKFTDTPWDQVLDIVLKNAGLGKEINNNVLRVAKTEKLQKEAEDRRKLEEAKALAGDLQTVTRPLSYAKVSDVSNLVKNLISKRGSVIIDERTNTLILTDLPQYVKTVEELIQTLDVQIQQVVIEARVVEANKDWQKSFGVQWPTSNGGSHTITGATFGSYNGPSWNSVNNRAPIDNTGSIVGGDGQLYGHALAGAFSGGEPGVTDIAAPAGEFWLSFLTNRFSINVILQALESNGVVKIVSSPKVVTQNNMKATILSGQKIPYPTQQGGAQGGAITVAFVDANLQLDVTPQITNEGTIIMDLHLTKAEADFSHTVNGTPSILQKTIQTQVLVRDGGTAVLGGVYITQSTKQSTGVPFLMHLPILGALFRNKTNQEQNSELLIFVTPRILHQ